MKKASRRLLLLVTLAIVLVTGAIVVTSGTNPALAKPNDKDKTPPVISDLRVESITESSAVLLWTTDEPADSEVRYGIDPKTNIHGPSDAMLVLSHAVALSDLTVDTTYAFCARSRDEANNLADSCGTFTTTSEPPPPPGGPSPTGGGAGFSEPPKPQAAISGFAYPDAVVRAMLQKLPFQETIEKTASTAPDGSFSIAFDRFAYGFYVFVFSATDRNGATSALKGIQFESPIGSKIEKEQVLIPPTLILGRTVVAWGDDLAVSGSAMPNTGVLVQVGDVSYETKSDDAGTYTMLINTARLTPGKISIRARSSAISDFGYDYSLTKTFTITATAVPKADLNADGVVNIKDFSIFLSHPVDMNGDGKVDSTDISIFLRAFAL